MHKDLPGEATDPMVSMAQVHWCHVLGSVVGKHGETWVAGLRRMEH